MNSTAAPLTQVQPAKSPSETGRQQAGGTPDVSFSQVLSGEIAHHQQRTQTRDTQRTDAASEKADLDTATASAETPTADTTAATPTPETGVPATETSASEAGALQPDAPPLPGTPDAILAMAMQLDLLKSAPAGTETSSSEIAIGADASATLRDARKGATRPAWLTLHPTDATESANKPETRLTGQSEVRGVPASTLSSNSVAAAFAGQLAAARQADALKSGELLPDMPSTASLSLPSLAATDSPAPLGNSTPNTLAPSVGTTAWSQALGDKIVWMAAGAQQTATLTLNPPNLGPLQIVLNVTNDQASANFFTAQPEVRQALETAFPRLREMMNDAGIQLGQASVSAETPGQHASPERQAQETARPFIGSDEAHDSLAMSIAPRLSGRGLIDTFA